MSLLYLQIYQSYPIGLDFTRGVPLGWKMC